MEYVLDGYCGVYCGACPVLLATKDGNLEAEKQCYGCKSEKPTGFCTTCGIKACAQVKGFEFCIECSALKDCDLIRNFVADKQNPYGQCVLKNMDAIQDIGLPEWLEMQTKRWRCKNCSTPFSWYHETCSQCGLAVESYKAEI